MIAQRLLPKIGGGRLPAVEIMMNTTAVANVIREGKTYELPNIIRTSAASGMIVLDHNLAQLVRSNQVKVEDVLQYTSDRESFESLLRR